MSTRDTALNTPASKAVRANMHIAKVGSVFLMTPVRQQLPVSPSAPQAKALRERACQALPALSPPPPTAVTSLIQISSTPAPADKGKGKATAPETPPRKSFAEISAEANATGDDENDLGGSQMMDMDVDDEFEHEQDDNGPSASTGTPPPDTNVLDSRVAALLGGQDAQVRSMDIHM